MTARTTVKGPDWDTNYNRQPTAVGEAQRLGYERRHGPITKVTTESNLLGEPRFRQLTFADGCYYTFCLDVFGGWFCRNGGKAYESRNHRRRHVPWEG